MSVLLFKNDVYTHGSVGVGCMSPQGQVPEEAGIGGVGIGVPGCCEPAPLGVSAGNCTQVLSKNSALDW